METTHTTPQSTTSLWIYSTVTAIFFFLLSTGYLWARRWGVPLEDVLYKITFAGLAVSGTVMLASSYFLGPLARTFPRVFGGGLTIRKYFGMVGFFMIVVHVFWGLATLTPAYYPKFFHGEVFTGQAMVFLMTGTVGFFLFLLVALTSLKTIAQGMPETAWRTMQRLGYLGLFVVLIHFTAVKYKGWLNVNDWPYLPDSIPILSLAPLPPLSLILFVYIVFVLFVRLCTVIIHKR